MENLDAMCLEAAEAERNLSARLRDGTLDPERLRRMSVEYGTKATQAMVLRAIAGGVP